ncbi:hypothetical protein KHA80_17035 [Anaerobacillus sp. HL2]|nr:hypothetical protein KHA80_17035 [Anaerobacillus sp. HL2]
MLKANGLFKADYIVGTLLNKTYYFILIQLNKLMMLILRRSYSDNIGEEDDDLLQTRWYTLKMVSIRLPESVKTDTH